MELTLITAYFDIGRDKFKGFERGNNKYINSKWYLKTRRSNRNRNICW